jgi:RNA polymerase subunit RPABC4/transcription elongation factor Spt4
MSKRKASSGGAIECPADGEEFANGIALAEHQTAAGPVCPTCETHVDPEEWIGLVGRVEALKAAESDEAAVGKDAAGEE